MDTPRPTRDEAIRRAGELLAAALAEAAANDATSTPAPLTPETADVA
ncbi:hypothetical protein [Cellulomonas sp.]|nr:hypothetical protein [Cellulomonas sp.]MBO9556729.1 hypothetical protein [Cellulomonas sp.]